MVPRRANIVCVNGWHRRFQACLVLCLGFTITMQSTGSNVAMGSCGIAQTFSNIRQALADRKLDGATRSKLKTSLVKAEEESRTIRMDAASSRLELKKVEAQLHRGQVLLRSKTKEVQRYREVADQKEVDAVRVRTDADRVYLEKEALEKLQDDRPGAEVPSSPVLRSKTQEVARICETADKKEADAARARVVADKIARQLDELEREHCAKELEMQNIKNKTLMIMEQSRLADVELHELRFHVKQHLAGRMSVSSVACFDPQPRDEMSEPVRGDGHETNKLRANDSPAIGDRDAQAVRSELCPFTSNDADCELAMAAQARGSETNSKKEEMTMGIGSMAEGDTAVIKNGPGALTSPSGNVISPSGARRPRKFKLKKATEIAAGSMVDDEDKLRDAAAEAAAREEVAAVAFLNRLEHAEDSSADEDAAKGEQVSTTELRNTTELMLAAESKFRDNAAEAEAEAAAREEAAAVAFLKRLEHAEDSSADAAKIQQVSTTNLRKTTELMVEAESKRRDNPAEAEIAVEADAREEAAAVAFLKRLEHAEDSSADDAAKSEQVSDSTLPELRAEREDKNLRTRIEVLAMSGSRPPKEYVAQSNALEDSLTAQPQASQGHILQRHAEPSTSTVAEAPLQLNAARTLQSTERKTVASERRGSQRKKNGRKRSRHFATRHPRACSNDEKALGQSSLGAGVKPTVGYVLDLFKSMHVEDEDDEPSFQAEHDSVENLHSQASLHYPKDGACTAAMSSDAWSVRSSSPLSSPLQVAGSAGPARAAGVQEEFGRYEEPEKTDGEAAIARLQDIYKEKARLQEIYKAAGEYIVAHSPNVEAERKERLEFYMGLGMGADEARLLVHNLMYTPEREAQRMHMVSLYTGLGVEEEEANALVHNLMML